MSLVVVVVVVVVSSRRCWLTRCWLDLGCSQQSESDRVPVTFRLMLLAATTAAIGLLDANKIKRRATGLASASAASVSFA